MKHLIPVLLEAPGDGWLVWSLSSSSSSALVGGVHADTKPIAGSAPMNTAQEVTPAPPVEPSIYLKDEIAVGWPIVKYDVVGSLAHAQEARAGFPYAAVHIPPFKILPVEQALPSPPICRCG